MTTKTCQKPERESKAILTTTTPSVHIRALGIKLHMKYIMGYEEDPRRAYAKHGAAWLDIGSRTLTNAWSKQLLSEKLSRQMGPPHTPLIPPWGDFIKFLFHSSLLFLLFSCLSDGNFLL